MPLQLFVKASDGVDSLVHNLEPCPLQHGAWPRSTEQLLHQLVMAWLGFSQSFL